MLHISHYMFYVTTAVLQYISCVLLLAICVLREMMSNSAAIILVMIA